MIGDDEIFGLLSAGTPADLERIAAEVASFPHGCDNFVHRAWIINAVDCGSLEAVMWMLDRGVELNFVDEEGLTPILACQQSDRADRHELLRRLLDAGADPNLQGFNDWTALHAAAAWNDLQAVRILLEQGADPCVRTRIDDYATPAEEAERLGRDDAARLIRTFASRTRT